ncbi:peroxide stress protein YaaA [Flammeovirgaceae bacterium SG7u.111]|nr:peroxide stress protein YaaA [Flammeovirgaceae bacterium SG7u.132]WPO38472.1 peroxide stress protein YaaA [Flammeovirgaceae bacterium SG7u.111]
MIIVISPAKTLDYKTLVTTSEYTLPRMLADTEKLAVPLKKKKAKDLAKLMSISENLAELNQERFAAWHPDFNLENARQALFAFKGDVYEGLEAYTLSNNDLKFAQDHLRILSGFYGLLKPLDLIQPYRLEMGTKLKIGRKNNLYEFWDGKITNELNNDLNSIGSEVVINLASNEYFKSVKVTDLKSKVITPVFKDFKNGNYKVISFFAKKARGMMTSWIIRNKITDAEQLTAFDSGGYGFNSELSSGDELVFTRG